jgi:hypothetical protein
MDGAVSVEISTEAEDASPAFLSNEALLSTHAIFL